MLRYQYHKNAEYRKMLQRISILVMFSLALEMVVAVTETEHKWNRRPVISAPSCI